MYQHIEVEQDYNERIHVIELLIDKAIILSEKRSKMKIDSWEEQLASVIFKKIIAISNSIYILLPKDQSQKPENFYYIWDYSSICILSRSLIETYLILFYSCIDKPTDENEKNIKRTVWEYYSNKKNMKIINLLSIGLENIDAINADLEVLKVKMQSNIYFKKLDSKIKNKIKKGEKFKIFENDELARKIGIDQNFFKSTFQYFSSYVHSDSYSLDQLKSLIPGDANSFSLLCGAIYSLVIYLSLSIRDFVNIFPELKIGMDDFIKNVITNSEKIIHLED